MVTENKDTTTEEAKGPAKKLGLSKVVYGLGMGARDALVTIVAGTAALFPVMYYGQERSKFIDTIAKLPSKLNLAWKKNLGERAGKAGNALVVASGVAFLASHLTNIPGLVKGPKKIREAEETYNAEVEDNRKLALEIKGLTETVKRQGMELTDAKLQNPVFAEHMKAAEVAAETATPAVEQPKAGFAAQFATDPAQTNGEKVLAKRAANADNIQQSA